MEEPLLPPGVGKAWARLVRAHRAVTTRIEADLKDAGFPPLVWYDVLLELGRAEGGRLSPGQLEGELLFAQYNVSRLLDRMASSGLVRREPHPDDRRRQLVAITPEGRALRERMWPSYAAAIERHLGAKLPGERASLLSGLLARLMPERGG
jgi:DNA-binding MarR family transcriptional regulator